MREGALFTSEDQGNSRQATHRLVAAQLHDVGELAARSACLISVIVSVIVPCACASCAVRSGLI